LRFTQILRYLLKFAVAAFWLVVLPMAYFKSVLNPTGLVKFFSQWIGDWQNQSFYNYCVAIYFIPNILASLLFFFPHLRRSMERSNWRIVILMMWWAQVIMCRICHFTEAIVPLFDLLLFVDCVAAKALCWKRNA